MPEPGRDWYPHLMRPRFHRRPVLEALARALLSRLRRDQSGQAMVESAIVIPLMIFLILGVIQLVMIQHAKIMTEYAAYNATRAGIVWNADKIIMENAAIISLLPTYEGLFKESDLGNPTQMLKRILQRALMYQKNKRLPQAIDLLKNGANSIISKLPVSAGDQSKLSADKDKLLDGLEQYADTALQQGISKALGAGDDRLVTVEILEPTKGLFGTRGKEKDFDAVSNRDSTRLSIKITYLYYMRVPFANWVIHQAWLALNAGKHLTGAIWAAQSDPNDSSFSASAKGVEKMTFINSTLSKMSALGQQGVYMVPLKATYTMRMQSNPYKQSLEVE
jgi:hypothetical protein